LLLTE